MFTVEKISILRTFDNLWLGLEAVVTLLGRRAGQGLKSTGTRGGGKQLCDTWDPAPGPRRN